MIVFIRKLCHKADFLKKSINPSHAVRPGLVCYFWAGNLTCPWKADGHKRRSELSEVKTQFSSIVYNLGGLREICYPKNGGQDYVSVSVTGL
jgi:hypothetical protein